MTPCRADALVPACSDSPHPLYQQVKDRILEGIADGRWPSGNKIPSENQLVKELGVSRMTVHRALRELSQEGHLQRVAGVGSFVAEPPRQASLIELRNIADEVRAQGSRHRARLILRRRETLGGQLAERLEQPVGTAVLHVVLVHSSDGLPIQLEDRWIDPRRVPGLMQVDFEAVTPSEYLLRSVRPQEMEHVVRAVLPDAKTCEHLAIGPAEPCLRLERRTWNRGRVVTYAVLTYPSSRYDLGARYTLGAGLSPQRADSPQPQDGARLRDGSPRQDKPQHPKDSPVTATSTSRTSP